MAPTPLRASAMTNGQRASHTRPGVAAQKVQDEAKNEAFDVGPKDFQGKANA